MHVPTRGDHILDLIFSKSNKFINEVNVLNPIGNSDHNLITFKCAISKPKLSFPKFPCFRKCNYTDLNAYIRSQNLLNLLQSRDPTSSWANLDTFIEYLVKTYVPVNDFDIERKRFTNPKLLKLIRKKFYFWRKYAKTKNQLTLHKYHQIKNKTRKFIDTFEKQNLQKLFSSKIKIYLTILEKH